MDCIRKQTYICAQYKLKIIYKTWQQKRSGKHVFFKKIQFLASHNIVATREDLSFDVSITNVGLILSKLGWYLFSGYGQIDRHDFGILIWKHAGRQKNSTQSSKLGVSCRSLYAFPDDGDA